MKSIGVLTPVRKNRRTLSVMYLALCLFLFVLAVPGPVLAAIDVEIGTGRQATIGTDPATGDRVISTPPPVPQEQNQGPQTIIVAPQMDLRQPVPRPGMPTKPYPPAPGTRPRP